MRRDQTSGESRELILDAAAELFALKGYRQTTFADVADRSGISRGSIPWHFGNKEGLLVAVLERSIDRLNATFTGTALPDPGTALDQLSQALEAFFRRPTTRLFATLLVEALEPGSPIHDRYAAIQQIMRTAAARILEHFGPPPGVSTDAVAAAIVGTGIGIHQQWLVAPDRVDLEQAMTAMRLMCAGLLSADPQS